MHPVPGRMRTLCAEKIAAKKSVFETFFQRAFSQARQSVYGNGHYVFICYRLENAAKIAYMEKRPYIYKVGKVGIMHRKSKRKVGEI